MLVARYGRFRFTAGAALAVLAAALLVPSPARAGCGDYVMLGPGAMRHPAGTAAPHAPIRPRAPCSGPSCSQRSFPLTAPLSTAPTVKERATAPLPCPPPTAGTFFFHADDHAARGIHRPTLIYHPPR